MYVEVYAKLKITRNSIRVDGEATVYLISKMKEKKLNLKWLNQGRVGCRVQFDVSGMVASDPSLQVCSPARRRPS